MLLPNLTSFVENRHWSPGLSTRGEPDAVFTFNTDIPGLEPQCGGKAGCSCGGAKKSGCGCGGLKRDADPPTPSSVYTFGDIRVQLPSQSVENEFYNVAVTDPNDRYRPFQEIAYKYLSRAENIYLARDMSWVFTIRGQINLYMIDPKTDRDLSVLIEAISPRPKTIDYDIVVGSKTGSQRAESSTGDMLPVIDYEKIYNITFEQYVNAIMKATGGTEPEATNLFSSALSLTNNTGDDDRFRALNFIVLRYMTFYMHFYQLRYVPQPFGAGTDSEFFDLLSVTTNGVEVFGKKRIMEIVFAFQGQKSSSTQTHSCTIDVSGEFPFVAVHWSKYFRGI